MATTQIDFEARRKSKSSGQGYDYRRQNPDKSRDLAHTKTGDNILEIARNYSSDHRIIPPGGELFAEGEISDNIYIVLQGWLFAHRILEDGRRQILDFALPGSVLGYHVDPHTPFTFSAEAITRAEVAVIPITRIRDLLVLGSSCAMTLLDATNRSLLDVFDTLTDVGRRTAREAVAHFLLRMSRRIQALSDTDAEAAVSFPLRQEHIGDALGLTSVHVCRTLGKLRKDGLIEIGQGRLRIVDAEALANDASVYNPGDDILSLAS